jgi:hypothetical protein
MENSDLHRRALQRGPPKLLERSPPGVSVALEGPIGARHGVRLRQ